MTIHLGTPRSWLCETPQLDLSDSKIHITMLKLTQSARGQRERARAIHDFVRRLPFGGFTDVSRVRASDVLRANRGDCHTKGVLFVALCREAGVPARLNFVRIKSRFLQGILEDGPETVTHAVGQVLIDDRWVATDAYVIDPVLFAKAKQQLRRQGSDCGWGIVRDANGLWDGTTDCMHQFRPADVLHNYGAYDDVAEFYAELSRDEAGPSWVGKLRYALDARLANRRVARLREAPQRRDVTTTA
jgi:hypothetical protein